MRCVFFCFLHGVHCDCRFLEWDAAERPLGVLLGFNSSTGFLPLLRTDVTFTVKPLHDSRVSFTQFLLRNIVPASDTQEQNIYFLRSGFDGAQREEKCLEEIGA